MTVKDNFDIEGLPGQSGDEVLRWGARRRIGRSGGRGRRTRRRRRLSGARPTCQRAPATIKRLQRPLRCYAVTPGTGADVPGGSSGADRPPPSPPASPRSEIGADIAGSASASRRAFAAWPATVRSWGLVSQRGMPLPPGFLGDFDLVVVGPMARSVRDPAAAAGCTGRRSDPADAERDPSKSASGWTSFHPSRSIRPSARRLPTSPTGWRAKRRGGGSDRLLPLPAQADASGLIRRRCWLRTRSQGPARGGCELSSSFSAGPRRSSPRPWAPVRLSWGGMASSAAEPPAITPEWFAANEAARADEGLSSHPSSIKLATSFWPR